MKTNYSRRELYALGEPMGESITRTLAGRRIYGGGGGGISDFVDSAVGSVGDLGQSAIDTVGNAGKSIDQTVRDVVPGGWTGAALMAAGAYYAPEIGAWIDSGTGGVVAGSEGVAPVATGSSQYALSAPASSGLGLQGSLAANAVDPYALEAAGGSGLGMAMPTASNLAAMGGGQGLLGLAADGSALGASGAYSGIGSTLSNLSNLKNAISGNQQQSGLSGAGLLAGLGGMAGLMALINKDKERYGVPGVKAQTPVTAFMPNQLAAPTINPNMFKPQGIQTAKVGYAGGGQVAFANGGVSSLGGYSDGGRMLKGPGDGMSDSIPASINGKQPARLANDEFVVPADVVSHLGNGSSDAGAKVLYKMMDRVRQARTGNKKQGKEINADRMMPK